MRQKHSDVNTTDDTDNNYDDMQAVPIDNETVNHEDGNSIHVERSVTDNAALFLLKAKEVRKVSESALSGMQEDIDELCKSKASTVGNEIVDCLRDMNCGADVVSEVMKIIQTHSNTILFSGLETAHLRQKYYSSQFHLVVSVSTVWLVKQDYLV